MPCAASSRASLKPSIPEAYLHVEPDKELLIVAGLCMRGVILVFDEGTRLMQVSRILSVPFKTN
jgi:hypothetical protein